MKLSESITFIRSLNGIPADNLLAQWQEQARKLESRVAKAQQNKTLEAAWQAAESRANFNARSCDRLIRDNHALNQHIVSMKRDASENANTVALNKHIANLTSENQRQKNTIRQLEDQNKNLEAALVKAEGQVRCLQGVVDTQTKMFHAVPTPGHDLSVRLERQRRTIDDYRAEVDKLLRQLVELTGQRDRLATELRDVRKAMAAKTLDCNDAANKLAEKTQQYNTLMTLHGNQKQTIDRYQRQTDELIGERNELKEKLGSLQRHNTSMGNTVSEVIDERNRLQRKFEQVTQRNDNQSGYIREYQEEIRKLREQLEAEKAKPAVVAHRYIEITGFDEESCCALCSISSYGDAGQLLERINRVPLV